MVFQSYALFPHMSVLENVMYGPLAAGASKAKAKEMAIEKLGLVGLAGLEARLPSELSGGQQQRVAVRAARIVLEPRRAALHEPLSNLDAKLRRKVRDDIRDLQQRLGLTVLYVTHDQQEALAVSDKVIVMDNAVIAQQGAPRELYERPNSRFLADFIGEANLIQGQPICPAAAPSSRPRGWRCRCLRQRRRSRSGPTGSRCARRPMHRSASSGAPSSARRTNTRSRLPGANSW